MGNSIIVRGLIAAACLFFSANSYATPLLHFSGKQGQSVDISNYSHSIPPTPTYAIALKFGNEDAQRLWNLMRANMGSQVAVRIGDQTTMTPVVRDVPTGTGLQLTLSNAEEFGSIKSALEATK